MVKRLCAVDTDVIKRYKTQPQCHSISRLDQRGQSCRFQASVCNLHALRRNMTKKQRTQAHRQAQRRYIRSTKGKAQQKRYNRTQQRTMWRTAYDKSPIGQAIKSSKAANRIAQLYGAPGSWTGTQFLALCKEYGNVCLCCRKKRRLTPDHVIPFCKGGTNYLSNIQPLCLSCNTSKRNNTTDYRLSTTQKRPQGVAVQLRKAA